MILKILFAGSSSLKYNGSYSEKIKRTKAGKDAEVMADLGVNAVLIVIAYLGNKDSVLLELVDQSVFTADSSRPISG